MRKLISKFVKYPFYANLVIAILLFAGGASMLSMKKSFFPETKPKFITVSVFYPGASPKEMEEGITARVEEATRGIVGIKEVNSTSSENFSSIRIETTGEYDLDETLMEVKNAVDGISSFPSAAERPIVVKQRSITWAQRISLSGDVDLKVLKKYANEIEEDFLNSGIISQIQINGYPALEISVECREADLMRYKLTFDEISMAIAKNNSDISAGMIKSDDEEILIRSRKRTVDPNKISDIVLRANPDGTHLLIRDVAIVQLKFADVSTKSFTNGSRSVSITVNKLPEEDLDEIAVFCRKYVVDFNKIHEDVKLDLTYDFLTVLGSRLDLLLRNGGTGLILVVISLAMFLSFRLSLWVSWGIPAAFLAMFVVANLYGITINMISLFGMILVIGILVDDGIVIAENIYSHFEKGKSPTQAAVDGTMEVLPSVVTSVLTTIVAFTPLLLLEGQMEFLFEMAFVVIFSLLFSLFEAFFVLPAHLGTSHVLSRKSLEKKDKGLRKYFERIINFMRFKIYGRALRVIVRWKYVFLFMPIALFMITIGLFNGGFIESTFFPAITFDMFSVNIAFTPGSGEKQTLEYLKKFDDQIWEVNEEMKKEFKDTAYLIKYSFMGVGSSFEGQEQGGHAGSIFVILRDMEGAPISSFEIVERVKKKIGEVPEIDKMTISAGNRWGSPISISLLGKNLVELKQARQFLMQELKQIPDLQNITNNNAAGKQEVQLQLKQKAYFLGMDHASISNQVRQGFYGGQAQRLQKGRDELRVWVRYPKQDRLNLGQLERMKIKTLAGEIPLSELADYNIERGPVGIQRYNGSREIRVDADLVDSYAPVPPIIARVDSTIIPHIKAKFPGVKIQYQGQQKNSSEAQEQMQKYFGIAFVIMVLILMIHFKSTAQAVIILMMIPISLLGACWGHGFHGLPVSMLSAWGMVALTGVIINDAVVYLSKYNSLLIEGQTVEEAVYNAGIARFRPIMLTTITTSAGLFPLILEKSFQAQFLIPMATSLAYGVLIGTGFILIFFPVLILTLNDLKLYTKWLWTGKKPNREEVEVAVLDNARDI